MPFFISKLASDRCARAYAANLMPSRHEGEEDEEEDPQQGTLMIHDMSVAKVRKSLSYMRKEWSRHSCVLPFFPCVRLPDTDITISEFAFRFVMGHHHKRHQKVVS